MMSGSGIAASTTGTGRPVSASAASAPSHPPLVSSAALGKKQKQKKKMEAVTKPPMAYSRRMSTPLALSYVTRSKKQQPQQVPFDDMVIPETSNQILKNNIPPSTTTTTSAAQATSPTKGARLKRSNSVTAAFFMKTSPSADRPVTGSSSIDGSSEQAPDQPLQLQLQQSTLKRRLSLGPQLGSQYSIHSPTKTNLARLKSSSVGAKGKHMNLLKISPITTAQHIASPSNLTPSPKTPLNPADLINQSADTCMAADVPTQWQAYDFQRPATQQTRTHAHAHALGKVMVMQHSKTMQRAASAKSIRGGKRRGLASSKQTLTEGIQLSPRSRYVELRTHIHSHSRLPSAGIYGRSTSAAAAAVTHGKRKKNRKKSSKRGQHQRQSELRTSSVIRPGSAALTRHTRMALKKHIKRPLTSTRVPDNVVVDQGHEEHEVVDVAALEDSEEEDRIANDIGYEPSISHLVSAENEHKTRALDTLLTTSITTEAKTTSTKRKKRIKARLTRNNPKAASTGQLSVKNSRHFYHDVVSKRQALGSNVKRLQKKISSILNEVHNPEREQDAHRGTHGHVRMLGGAAAYLRVREKARAVAKQINDTLKKETESDRRKEAAASAAKELSAFQSTTNHEVMSWKKKTLFLFQEKLQYYRRHKKAHEGLDERCAQYVPPPIEMGIVEENKQNAQYWTQQGREARRRLVKERREMYHALVEDNKVYKADMTLRMMRKGQIRPGTSYKIRKQTQPVLPRTPLPLRANQQQQQQEDEEDRKEDEKRRDCTPPPPTTTTKAAFQQSPEQQNERQNERKNEHKAPFSPLLLSDPEYKDENGNKMDPGAQKLWLTCMEACKGIHVFEAIVGRNHDDMKQLQQTAKLFATMSSPKKGRTKPQTQEDACVILQRWWRRVLLVLHAQRHVVFLKWQKREKDACNRLASEIWKDDNTAHDSAGAADDGRSSVSNSSHSSHRNSSMRRSAAHNKRASLRRHGSMTSLLSHYSSNSTSNRHSGVLPIDPHLPARFRRRIRDIRRQKQVQTSGTTINFSSAGNRRRSSLISSELDEDDNAVLNEDLGDYLIKPTTKQRDKVLEDWFRWRRSKYHDRVLAYQRLVSEYHDQYEEELARYRAKVSLGVKAIMPKMPRLPKFDPIPSHDDVDHIIEKVYRKTMEWE